MPDHNTITAELDQVEMPAAPEGRAPPKWIKVLEPVWGYEFTQQFLRFSLPSLLAPGNLPSLAQTLPTEFVFLTGHRDVAMIRDSAGFRRLSQICRVSFREIDELVTEGNHSTTVTLAFTAAVRRAGDAMLDTCFVFLVSDYIVADGSLASAIRPMLTGAGAVQAGNFQIVVEDAMPWLEQELGRGGDTLVLPPRALMRQALTCIHPATIANTVNLPLSHNSHCNRLFWRVDADTMIGRFYLMHMLCVRPEVVDFVIGASCDYSFVPEMCPSGNVAVMTDSDDYLVVETQSRSHESRFLRLGPAEPKRLAANLSEWTTALHRDNARHTLVFHAAQPPAPLRQMVAEADAYVGRIAQLLSAKPKPHRDHPYWRGAMAAHQSQRGQRPDDDDWQLMLGRRLSWSARMMSRLRKTILGRAPKVRRWHPRWADFRQPRAELEEILANPARRLLVVSGAPTALTNWLADSSDHILRIPISRLLRPDPERSSELQGTFDACFLEITDLELDRAHLFIDRITPLLKPDANVLVVSFNGQWFSGAEAFAAKFANNAQRILRHRDLALESMRLVVSSRWCWIANRTLIRLTDGIFQRPSFLAPFQAVGILVVAMIAFAGNLINRNRVYKPHSSLQIVSSVSLRLRIAGGARGDRPEIYGEAMPRPIVAVSTGADDGCADDSSATKEPQYQRLLEVQQEVGISSLGLMTNQVWHEDPRRLTFILARYKFVAKMLSGSGTVAEVGCGDAFGTRIVQQEVDSVTVYDFDSVFIQDIRRRQSAKWALEAEVHDILERPLPRRFDAVYSLDVIEHIPAEREDTFIHHLWASLADHGVLVIGSPSLESQSYASPQSKTGHVNCKSGRTLKLLLERYFHRVFLFSMNDEVVHTGFYPMAHYLFALCSNKR
jgi:hypothetical protein